MLEIGLISIDVHNSMIIFAKWTEPMYYSANKQLPLRHAGFAENKRGHNVTGLIQKAN